MKPIISKTFSVQCLLCKYYDTKNAKCPAFDKISLEVFNGTIKHDKILPNQKGEYIFTER